MFLPVIPFEKCVCFDEYEIIMEINIIYILYENMLIYDWYYNIIKVEEYRLLQCYSFMIFKIIEAILNY